MSVTTHHRLSPVLVEDATFPLVLLVVAALL